MTPVHINVASRSLAFQQDNRNLEFVRGWSGVRAGRGRRAAGLSRVLANPSQFTTHPHVSVTPSVTEVRNECVSNSSFTRADLCKDLCRQDSYAQPTRHIVYSRREKYETTAEDKLKQTQGKLQLRFIVAQDDN